jgi:hypothetical protein
VSLAERCLLMSNCRSCSKSVLCDWLEPPEDCADYRLTNLQSIEDMIHAYLDKYCEVFMRGGTRYRGWVRGMDGDYLLFQLENKSVLAIDLDNGAELRPLVDSVDEDVHENKGGHDTCGGIQ